MQHTFLKLALVLSVLILLTSCIDSNNHQDQRRVTTQTILGKQTSALYGVKGDDILNPFLPVAVTDLITTNEINTETNDQTAFGPFIQMTFHPDFPNLLHEFFSVIHFFDDSFKAGGLVMQPNFLDDSNAQLTIAKRLGILPEHTTDSKLSFVLMRYWKKIRTHKTAISVNGNYIEDFKDITRFKTDDIISLFLTYGTHFVSQYDEGDFIYQVFVYEKEIFDQIENEWPDDTDHRFGYKGIYFRPYTEERWKLPDGSFAGYAYYAGDILAASHDSTFPEIIPFLFDDVYKVYCILMFLTDSSISGKTEDMNTLIPSQILLGSLSNLIHTSEENDQYLAWEEVMRASIFQKFGMNSSPGFYPVLNGSQIAFYDSFNPDLVTSTATSYTAITQTAFDLSDLKILNPQFVTDLFIFADVIELKENTKISLPGSTSIHLICREFISYSAGNIVPEIIVGNTPTIKIITASFLGTMKLTNSQRHVTFNGGSVFVTKADNEFYTVETEPTLEFKLPTPSNVPEIYNTHPQIYRDEWFSRSYINGMQLLAITTESIYSLQSGDSVETAEKCLNWMIDVLQNAKNQTKLSEDLEVVLSRLLLIEKTNPHSEQPLVLVPTLTFPQYEELYNSLLENVESYEEKLSEISQEISTRLQTETIIDSQEQLNENILEIGKFLVAMVEADAEYFEDIQEMYESFESQKLRELDYEQEKSVELYNEVLHYTEQVGEVGEKLTDEVEAAAVRAIFQAVLSIALAIGTMFVGGAGIGALPGEVQGIAKVAEKVDYCITLTEQMSAIYNLGEDIASGADQINSELAELPDVSLYSNYFPTALDWSDFDADVEMFTSEGYLTCCKTTGAEYKNVANKLSQRGKAYLDSQSKVSALQYEITVNNIMASVAEQQKVRLEELAEKFSHEELDDYQANTTDLYELGNILQGRANDVRMKLARTYLTMDAALQYYYLKPPTILQGYDTLDIKETASRQVADSIVALENFPTPPTDLSDPIIYEISLVRISSLTSAEGYKHRIPLTASAFQDFVRVRIKEVKVTINSIASADKDDIYIQCNYTGLNFMDRGLEREKKVYHTMSTEYRYVYNYKTGETVVGNSVSPGFEDVYAMMTPFGEWIFRIPELQSDNTNVNIKYSSRLTTIRIEFYLNVIFHPQTSYKYSSSSCVNSPTSVECLLEMTHENTITGDWDAVMSLDAHDINELWKQKHEHQDHGGLAYNITTDWQVISDTGSYLLEGRMSGLVGPPLVSFVPNNPDSLQMTMEMNNATYEEKFTYGDEEPEITTTHYKDPIIIVSFNSISKIQGNISSQQMVIVDLESSIIDVTIHNLTGSQSEAMTYALEDFFQTALNSSSYELGTVEFDPGTTPLALQPRGFLFTTGGFKSSSSGYGTFYMCILTYSSRNLPDPVLCEIQLLSKDTDPVIPNGYTAALYISSQVIFEDIILPEFAAKFGQGASATPIPGVDLPAYQLSGSSITFRIQYTDAPTCVGAQHPSIDFTIPANNFQVVGDASGLLHLFWNQDFSHSIIYYKDVFGYLTCSISQKHATIGFQLRTDEAKLPTINSEQMITFPPFTFEHSTLSADEDSGDKGDASKGVVEALKNKIAQLSIQIDPVSVFALTNLLFPEAKVINTTAAFLSGDMLVLGHVERDYKPIT